MPILFIFFYQRSDNFSSFPTIALLSSFFRNLKIFFSPFTRRFFYFSKIKFIDPLPILFIFSHQGSDNFSSHYHRIRFVFFQKFFSPLYFLRIVALAQHEFHRSNAKFRSELFFKSAWIKGWSVSNGAPSLRKIDLSVPSDTRRAPLSRVHINNINKSWCARCAPRVSRRVDWYTIAPSINGVKRCARGVVAWHTWRFQSRSFSSRNAASVHLFPRRGFKAGEGNKFPSFFRSAIRYFQPVVYTEIPTTAILCLFSLSLSIKIET